jgi:hypothetical protein
MPELGERHDAVLLEVRVSVQVRDDALGYESLKGRPAGLEKSKAGRRPQAQGAIRVGVKGLGYPAARLSYGWKASRKVLWDRDLNTVLVIDGLAIPRRCLEGEQAHDFDRAIRNGNELQTTIGS